MGQAMQWTVSEGRRQVERGNSRAAIAAVWLGALALAGCAAKPQEIITSSQASRASVERSFIDMPAGGPAILGIVERNYANATTQEITLENHARVVGENKFWVTMIGPVVQTTAPQNRMGNDPLTLLNVSREFGWYLPGVKMSVSNYYTQNRYGPFGYATGRSGGDTCIYAWQRIQANNVNGNWFSRQGAILIRLRFCAPASRETDLLTLMTSFNINSYFLSGRWNPYNGIPPVPEDLGRPGVSILPPPTVYTTGSVEPATRTVRRAATVQPVVATPPPVEVIREGAAVVPLDTGVTAADLTASVKTGAAATPPAEATPLEGYPVVPPP